MQIIKSSRFNSLRLLPQKFHPTLGLAPVEEQRRLVPLTKAGSARASLAAERISKQKGAEYVGAKAPARVHTPAWKAKGSKCTGRPVINLADWSDEDEYDDDGEDGLYFK